MDPYIINNMPDEEPTSLLTLACDLGAGTVLFDIVHDGNSYVLCCTDAGANPTLDSQGAAVIAAFDPKLDPPALVSLLLALSHGEVIGASAEGNEILLTIFGGANTTL
jgi:hypothetical protein